MATEKQIEANRLNSQKSTGPRTEAAAILPASTPSNTAYRPSRRHDDAERELRDAFMAGIIDSLKPADALERQLAHSIADATGASTASLSLKATSLRSTRTIRNSTARGFRRTEVDRALAPALTFMKHPSASNSSPSTKCVCTAKSGSTSSSCAKSSPPAAPMRRRSRAGAGRHPQGIR